MGHPIAFCLTHGFFVYGGFAIDGVGADFTLENIQVDCPTCGQFCEILPGLYELTSTGMRLSLSPTISPGAYKALLQIARSLQRGDVSIDDAAKAVEQAAPPVAAIFEKAVGYTKRNHLALASLLLAVAGTLHQCSGSTPHEKRMEDLWNRLINQREHSEPIERPDDEPAWPVTDAYQRLTQANSNDRPNRKARRRAAAELKDKQQASRVH